MWKAFWKKLREIVENIDGSLSARRVGGIILLGAGLVGWFLKLDATVATIILGIGAALLGITTADPHPPSSV